MPSQVSDVDVEVTVIQVIDKPQYLVVEEKL